MTLLQEPETLKRTPLYERHVSLGGKIVNFGGWSLPVYYTGIIAEHQWTRQSCSFFDVSHLGEIHVKGPGALSFLQKQLTNDISKCPTMGMMYALLCDEAGHALDDILVYRGVVEDYYLIVNAANTARDFKELKKCETAGLELHDRSDETACVAVQGPKAEAILEKLFGFKLKKMAYYSFKVEKFKDQTVWISRSGYTGEDGFELFCMKETAPMLWDVLIAEGKKEGALPAGLGARNTLRLEAGNVLYGHELDEQTTPLEAGLGFVISWDKGDFVGRSALDRQKKEGVAKKLVAFKMTDKAVARDGYPVFADGNAVGKVTSGSYAPTVGANIGLAFVTAGNEKLGNILEIEIHGRRSKAEIIKRPFVALKHKKN